MEKECKWHFLSEGPSDIGPNDAIVDNFKGRPYYSIVREAIQNSLDVQLDKKKPVTVKFDWFELDRLSFPNLFGIEEHIIASNKYYANNGNAKQLFGNMLLYLNGNTSGRKKLRISCLKISESNTSGMKYVKGESDSPFQGFLRSQGNSIKSDSGSGGSFGYGKGAYFALSPIKTVIVSTKTKEGKCFMEGCTRLSTHKDVTGEKISSVGYYDNNFGEPVTEIDNIPEIFQRNDAGTDFNIIGLWDKDDRKEIMVKTVLNNFWLAIWDEKLVVEIDNIRIDKESLERTINQYYSGESEYGSAEDFDNWNPKPYFKAVKYAESNEQFKKFNGQLETLGDVQLYIYLNKGLPNRISFFRGLKMIVYKGRRKNIINGYAGVFLCENEEGNRILRNMENPAHNEWSKANYPKEMGEISSIAWNAENEIRNYVNSTLKGLSKSRLSENISISGLEEYLYSTEELLEEHEEQESGGNSSSETGGRKGENISDEETGIQTTENEKAPVRIKATNSKDNIFQEEALLPDQDGLEDGTSGFDGVNRNGDEDSPRPPGSHESSTVSFTDDEIESKRRVKIELKVVARKEKSDIYHSLIITSKKAISDCELVLFVSGDNENSDGIDLVSSSNGRVERNSIRNVTLNQGRNIVDIKFSDNVKHSIKITAYEI